MMKSRRTMFLKLRIRPFVIGGVAFWLLFNTSVITAFAMCCKCHAAGKTDNICLTDTAITSCGDILKTNSKNTALGGLSCEIKELENGCEPIAANNPSALCKVGPVSAIQYSAGANSAATASVKPVTPPELNIPIPGLKFSQVTVDGQDIKFPWLAQYLASIYNYLIGASLVVAAVMIVYGGFKYILSATAPSISGAQETIRDAIAGLILVLCAYLILNTLMPTATKLGSFKLLKVDRSEFDVPSAADVEKSAKIAKGQIPPPPPPPPSPRDKGASLPPAVPEKVTPLPAEAQVPDPSAGGPEPSQSPPIQPVESSQGCQDPGGKVLEPLTLSLDWAPPNYLNYYAVKGSKLMQSGVSSARIDTTQQRILVDGRIRNCPGNYPVIFFFHGNKGYLSLETSIGALTSYKNVMTKGALWGSNKKDFPPFIAVFPASSGESETLWPGMTLSALRDAALETLHKFPETSGVNFSTLNVAAHSGTGCNKNFWGNPSAMNVPIHTMIYADVCFGYNDAKQQPTNLIASVSKMDNTDYLTFAKAHEMDGKGAKCRSKYRGPYSQCWENPKKNYFLFYHMNPNEPDKGRNHGWPIGLTLIFALENNLLWGK